MDARQYPSGSHLTEDMQRAITSAETPCDGDRYTLGGNIARAMRHWADADVLHIVLCEHCTQAIWAACTIAAGVVGTEGNAGALRYAGELEKVLAPHLGKPARQGLADAFGETISERDN